MSMNATPQTTLSPVILAFKHLGAGALALGALGVTQRAEAENALSTPGLDASANRCLLGGALTDDTG